MTSDSIINIDFFRTILSVIIGGVISLTSVLLIELRKSKKDKTERQKALYAKLIGTLNSLRRIEKTCIQDDMGYAYNRQCFEMTKDDISKRQAEYHLQRRNDAILNMNSKAEEFDSLCIQYELEYGTDTVFDKVTQELKNWPRPKKIRYFEVVSLDELNKKYENDTKKLSNYAQEYWDKRIKTLITHIKDKLK
ncbi:hypothetical protein [Polaribacter sp. NJDZ03]|uniref:hypothetical protein n=1 Tax=Polaribacter sp. NJDZ03 TaxID=2855841 RepID=UPI001C4A1E0C|nr:hypothetical protein [Polaribacter sp. NJDZ03]